MNLVQNLSSYARFPSVFTGISIGLPSILMRTHDVLTQVTESQQLQNAISAASDESIEALIRRTPQLLRNPLPNGDLPLHYAAKISLKPEVVATLLKHGADPMLKDDQQLSAVDCAKLANNQQALATILKHYVADDMRSLNDFQSHKAAKTAVNTIHSLAKSYPTKDLSPLQKAVIEKDIEKVKLLLAELGSATVPLTTNRDSLIHLAVLSGNAQILTLCLEHANTSGFIDHGNSQGLTPLHYAAAMERLDMMQLLAQKNANIRALDHHQVSPLAMLGADADTRDPLKVSKFEILFFTATVAMWSSQILAGPSIGWQTVMLLNSIIPALSTFIFELKLKNSFKTTNGYLANFAVWFILPKLLPNNPYAILAFDAYNLSLVAKSAFEGLKSCWRNAALGNTRALFKAAVAHGPTVSAAIDRVKILGISLGVLDHKPVIALPEEINSGLQFCAIQVKELQEKTGFKCRRTTGVLDCSMFKPNDSSNDMTNCMEIWNNVFESCNSDPNSSACEIAKDNKDIYVKRWTYLFDFLKSRPYFEQQCEKNSIESRNCLEKIHTYEKLCIKNFHSTACFDAENLIREKSDKPVGQDCHKAILYLTGKPESTLPEIKRAFHKKSLSVHPDKQDSDAEFKLLSDTYAIAKECSK